MITLQLLSYLIYLQVHFTRLRALAERTPSMPLLAPHQPNAHALNGATPQMYFGPGASSNLIPRQSAINGFQQQHPIQRFRPVIPPHYMIPYHPPRQGQHGQRMSFGSGGAIPPQQVGCLVPVEIFFLLVDILCIFLLLMLLVLAFNKHAC